ncbi:MmpS family protein [Mycobacterium sp. SMC-14]|uniref:MmpS family protein n=1 Tax=Mycobacterium sp. SMC-14 TaxID=3385968 RepID=UPI00390CB11A
MWVRVSKACWCEGTSIFKVLSRVWIPLVILAVVCVAAFTVTRIHGLFGSEKRPSYSDGQNDETKPFNPKRLTYEIFGPPGTVADISYFDVNSEPQRVSDATLPWQLEIVTTLPAVVGSIMAQGNSNSIGCRIIVDGEVKAERISNEVNAYTFCLLKAA